MTELPTLKTQFAERIEDEHKFDRLVDLHDVVSCPERAGDLKAVDVGVSSRRSSIGRCSLRHFICMSATASIVFAASPALAETIAETGSFVEKSGIPQSASTTFNSGGVWDPSQSLAINTAKHELLHAIGFTKAYTGFSAHLTPSSTDDRLFCSSTGSASCAQAQILGILVPPQNGTHIDPKGGAVQSGKYNQALSIMQPDRVPDYVMDGLELSILELAMWSQPNKRPKIKPVFDSTLSAAQQGYVNDAIAAVEALFPSQAAQSEFTWTVTRAAIEDQSDVDNAPTSQLISGLDTADAQQRKMLAKAILKRGDQAIAELRNAGAKPASGISPRLMDLLYSLATESADGNISRNSFGIHLSPGTTRQQVVEIGKKWGFTLRQNDQCDPGSEPACYVTLKKGKDVFETMRNLITEEPAIHNLNFNHFEK